MKADHDFSPYPSPFRVGCVRCPLPESDHPAPSRLGVRDRVDEAIIMAQATTGSALDSSSLDSFAESRTQPGPVRLEGRSLRREALEEIADLRNYLIWEIQFDLAPRADAGDETAASRIPSRLGALRKIVEVWNDLHLP